MAKDLGALQKLLADIEQNIGCPPGKEKAAFFGQVAVELEERKRVLIRKQLQSTIDSLSYDELCALQELAKHARDLADPNVGMVKDNKEPKAAELVEAPPAAPVPADVDAPAAPKPPKGAAKDKKK